MGGTLTVHVGREQLHELVPESRSFEADGPFAVALRNHRRSVHVHLSLDEALSAVATLPDNNHFVESEQTVEVPIDVTAPDHPVSGRLKVVSGYGAETAYVDVTVNPPEPAKPRVEVDESLGQPVPQADRENRTGGGRDGLAAFFEDSGPVWLLAIVAVFIAGVTVASVQSTAVALGVLAVLVGVGVAVALLRE